MSEVSLSKIENMIYVIRGQKVMVDSDLAELYEVETKQLNRQVKRNVLRFPEDFMFQLTTDEFREIQNLKVKITDAVHASGGKILLQLWHGGRACHPLLNNGQECVSASAIAIEGETHTPKGKSAYTVPRALELNEIPIIVEGFKKAAMNAKEAGFDGVEVHGANGYILDQFLRDSCNKRSDSYGGSIANRAKLLLEVTKNVIGVWGADKVGVRLSPLNSYNSMKDSNPIELTAYVSRELSSLKIAYLHMMRADFFGLQSGDVMSVARENFNGILIGNMGYTASEADAAIQRGLMDAVAFGHHYVSNPDLVERIKEGTPIVEPDQATYYSQGKVGYTDYPFRN
jgi:N-ethylmaleimide reductase